MRALATNRPVPPACAAVERAARGRFVVIWHAAAGSIPVLRDREQLLRFA